ncbi:MAG: hypothetical protein IT562_10055 [Alphaproteobacteria bacterium]|nr:hypothetical protein [Alphaproteobacteria bacterium]
MDALTPLIAKILCSAVLVLGLSAIAERASARVAGIVAGAPQNAVLVYLFVGLDKGVDFVAESAPHGIASFTATIAFVIGYYRASAHSARYSALLGATSGIAAFMAVAAVLAAIPLTVLSGTILSLCAIAFSTWYLRRVASIRVSNPVRYTPRILLVRGSFAVALVVGVVALAEVLGARWTGLLAGFPATLLPALLIIHLTYGVASAHAIVRNFPLGVGSIILYLLSVPITFPMLGVYGGTAASFCISLAYLTAVATIGSRRSISQ